MSRKFPRPNFTFYSKSEVLAAQAVSFTISACLIGAYSVQTNTLPGPVITVGYMVKLSIGYIASTWFKRKVLGVIGAAVCAVLILPELILGALRAPACGGYFSAPCASVNIPLLRMESEVLARQMLEFTKLTRFLK